MVVVVVEIFADGGGGEKCWREIQVEKVVEVMIVKIVDVKMEKLEKKFFCAHKFVVQPQVGDAQLLPVSGYTAPSRKRHEMQNVTTWGRQWSASIVIVSDLCSFKRSVETRRTKLDMI